MVGGVDDVNIEEAGIHQNYNKGSIKAVHGVCVEVQRKYRNWVKIDKYFAHILTNK